VTALQIKLNKRKNAALKSAQKEFSALPITRLMMRVLSLEVKAHGFFPVAFTKM
jgi:hypothetical protein